MTSTFQDLNFNHSQENRMKAYTPDYVQKQVTYYNASISPSARADALWRISSHADLFEPQVDGPLSEIQQAHVLGWLASQGFAVVQDLFSL
jgi:hypothetical protein